MPYLTWILQAQCRGLSNHIALPFENMNIFYGANLSEEFFALTPTPLLDNVHKYVDSSVIRLAP